MQNGARLEREIEAGFSSEQPELVEEENDSDSRWDDELEGQKTSGRGAN